MNVVCEKALRGGALGERQSLLEDKRIGLASAGFVREDPFVKLAENGIVFVDVVEVALACIGEENKADILFFETLDDRKNFFVGSEDVRGSV